MRALAWCDESHCCVFLHQILPLSGSDFPPEMTVILITWVRDRSHQVGKGSGVVHRVDASIQAVPRSQVGPEGNSSAKLHGGAWRCDDANHTSCELPHSSVNLGQEEFVGQLIPTLFGQMSACVRHRHTSVLRHCSRQGDR